MKTNVKTISVTRMYAEIFGYSVAGIAATLIAMAGSDALGLTAFNVGGPVLQLLG